MSGQIRHPKSETGNKFVRVSNVQNRAPRPVLSLWNLNLEFVSDFIGRLLLLFLSLSPLSSFASSSADVLFRTGVGAFHAGDYSTAATAFWQAAAAHPTSGTMQNLGLTEWQRGRQGPAILAWEQALWLNPWNGAARENLRFARKTAQLEAPELAWYEVVSTWFPVNWWAWVAGLSLWLAIGFVLVPGILRLRKAAWHQAVAALCLAVFLLSLPALVGVQTRSKLGFVLDKDVPLRLTPTQEAQAVTRLAAGEPVRLDRVRGRYFLVHTSRGAGWLEATQFGLTCPH